MLRCCTFSCAPTVITYAHPACTPTAALVSSMTQRVSAAAKGITFQSPFLPKLQESQRYFRKPSWKDVDLLPRDQKGQRYFRDPWWMVADLLPKDKERRFLESTLKHGLKFMKHGPRDSDSDEALLDLLFVAHHSLVTQEDLGMMRKAGVLALVYEKYILPKDDVPTEYLKIAAEKLSSILSTPPKVTDSYHYLNQLTDSAKPGFAPEVIKDVTKESKGS